MLNGERLNRIIELLGGVSESNLLGDQLNNVVELAGGEASGGLTSAKLDMIISLLENGGGAGGSGGATNVYRDSMTLDKRYVSGDNLSINVGDTKPVNIVIKRNPVQEDSTWGGISVLVLTFSDYLLRAVYTEGSTSAKVNQNVTHTFVDGVLTFKVPYTMYENKSYDIIAWY